jgi:hypothetical protein
MKGVLAIAAQCCLEECFPEAWAGVAAWVVLAVVWAFWYGRWRWPRRHDDGWRTWLTDRYAGGGRSNMRSTGGLLGRVLGGRF